MLEMMMNSEKTVIAGILANIKRYMDVKDSSKTWQECQNLMERRVKCNISDNINKRLERWKNSFLGSSSLDDNVFRSLKNEIDELTKISSH